MKTFPEFFAYYTGKSDNPYLLAYCNQMIADGRTSQDDVLIEIEKFLQLKQSEDIVVKGLGWSCSDILRYCLEDWPRYQQKGENFFAGP